VVEWRRIDKAHLSPEILHESPVVGWPDTDLCRPVGRLWPKRHYAARSYCNPRARIECDASTRDGAASVDCYQRASCVDRSTTHSHARSHVDPECHASSGPLSVAVYVAGCKRAPAPGKPGNLIVQISIEATGGNGEYHYFNEGVESPTKFIDITWERGTLLTGSVRVVSGDGQNLKKDYNIPTGELTCQ
jgi:hypothetical protein